MTAMAKIQSLCVYCGSSMKGRDSHKQAATRLGTLLAKAGVRLVFGGGQVGLMGLTAGATLAAGGQVTGIIPKFLDEIEVGLRGCTDLIITPDMHTRKQKMAELSDAFVVLPGGLGTLDETFEILTWKQLGLHQKPVIIVDIDDYWAPLGALVDNLIEENYARAENRALYRFVDSVEEVLPALEAEAPYASEVEAKFM